MSDLLGAWSVRGNFLGFEAETSLRVQINEFGPAQDKPDTYRGTGCMQTEASGGWAPLSIQAVFDAEEGSYVLNILSTLIAPGLFAESSAGERVYYVESLNPLTGIVRNVFMQSRIDGQLGLVVAREGSHTELPDGSRYLVFRDGRLYEGTPGQLDYPIVQFERYWMRLDIESVMELQGKAGVRSTLDFRKPYLLYYSTPSDHRI